MKAFATVQNKFYEKLGNFQSNLVEKPRFSHDGVRLPSKPLYTSVETLAIKLLNEAKVKPSLHTTIDCS